MCSQINFLENLGTLTEFYFKYEYKGPINNKSSTV